MQATGQGRLVWIAVGDDEWVPGVVTAENVQANVAGRTDMRGQPLGGQQLTTCLLPDTGDSVTVPETSLRPRDPAGEGEFLESGLLGGGGSSPAKSGLLGGAKAKAAALQARITSQQPQPQQQQQQPASHLPGITGIPGEIRAVREEAVLTVTTPDGQTDISAIVAAFGERVARLSNVPLIRAYPPLADAQLTNPQDIRGAIAVIARGRVPFVEKARRAQVADAVGVIFINDTDEPYVALGMDGDSDIVLPVVCVRRSDGANICEQISKSKGVRHVCTASLSFGNSAAVSNELEAFLRNPAGAENIRIATKKKLGLAGRAIASAGEAARGGTKKSSLADSEYVAAPSGVSGSSDTSPPRSSATIVSEWISSRKLTKKGQKGQKAQGEGLSMDLQPADSIYNQPADSAPGVAPAVVPVHTPMPVNIPQVDVTQQTLTKLLSQHVTSTSDETVGKDDAPVPDVTVAPSNNFDAKSAQRMQILEAATTNAVAVAETNAKMMQQQYDIELKDVREAAAQKQKQHDIELKGVREDAAAQQQQQQQQQQQHYLELQQVREAAAQQQQEHYLELQQVREAASQQQQCHDQELKEAREAAARELHRVRDGAHEDMVAANARLAAERSAQVKIASALQSEKDAHGITRDELSTTASEKSRVQQLESEKVSAELQVTELQQQLQEMRSLHEELESVRALQSDAPAISDHVATAVSRAVVEANQTWEAKMQSVRQGFEFDLQEAETLKDKYKSESENAANTAAEAVSRAVEDVEKKAAEQQNVMGLELAQARSDLEHRHSRADQLASEELAVLNAELESLRRLSPSRAALATEIEAAVEAANAVSDGKLRAAEASFEAQLARVREQAGQSIAEAEQTSTNTTSELTELQQRISVEIQDAVDNAACESVAELEEMRRGCQAGLDSAEASAAAEKQHAESRIAELQETAERAQVELVANLDHIESNEHAAFQRGVDEAQAAADLKLQNIYKAHKCDLDEATQAERNLRSELAVLQGAESELSEESAKWQSMIAKKDSALQAAAQEADAKLQKAVRDFEMSRDEGEIRFAREVAEATASHQEVSEANLNMTVQNMQKQIDDATASAQRLESQLQQMKSEFNEDRSTWKQREVSLNAELALSSTQQIEMGKQLAESEQLVTEVSAELERVQSQRNLIAHASTSEIVGAEARLEQMKKAFEVDLQAVEAGAADRLDRVKEAARHKMEEVVEERQIMETSLQTAMQERLQALEELQVAQQTIAKMTADLSQAEAVLSDRSLEHNEAHQALSKAQQQTTDLQNELTACQADLDAERLASEENQAERNKVSDEMALALEAAHLKSDEAVQQARQAFRFELEEAETKASKNCSAVSEEAARQVAAAQQHAAESLKVREEIETALLASEREHESTKRKLLEYIDGQDDVLEMESQVEQLEAELVETAEQLGVSEDHHESLLERTQAAHAEALEGLQDKLESLGQAKSKAEEISEDALQRMQLYEQEQSRINEDEQNLHSELREANSSRQRLTTELEHVSSKANADVDTDVAALTAQLQVVYADLEQSKNELFHTAEDAVATEVKLKCELDGIRCSRDEFNSKLAATVAERENMQAQLQIARHECEQLRMEVQESKDEMSTFNKTNAARAASIEAENSQLQASVEKLSRQLRLKLQPTVANDAVAAPDSERSDTTNASRQQNESNMQPPSTVLPPNSIPAADLAVVGLQSEMELLRSQLEQRANENQNLQQQIHQLQQSQAQLADEQSKQTSSEYMAPPQPLVASTARVSVPATPDRPSVLETRTVSPQLESPVRDHAAELETLEVMVHALRQEASAVSSPGYSDRAGSRLATSPTAAFRAGSQTAMQDGEWATEVSAQVDSDAQHHVQVFDDADDGDAYITSSEGAAFDAPRRLCEAVASGAGAVVKMLVQDRRRANALWDRADGATLLHAAAFNGHAHVAEHLLRFGADVDRSMINGATPIFAAAQQGHVDVLDELLSAGAMVNWVSDDGSTPLYVAAWKGHAAIVSRLLNYGAHADRYHRERATPLFVAAQEGHASVVRVLLGAGADASRPWQDAHGRKWSPIDKATANRHLAVVALLRESQQQHVAGRHRTSHAKQGANRGATDATRTPDQKSSVSRSPSLGSNGSPAGAQYATPRRPSPVRRHRSSRQARASKPESTGWR